jgi:hypothetical protein
VSYPCSNVCFVSTPAVDESLALLRRAVDGLLAANLPGLSSAGLVGVLAEVEVQRCRLAAVDVQVVAEAEDRRVAGEYGRTSTADLLVQVLRVSPREAAARVDRARELGPRRELTGAPLPPLLPATAEALVAGQVSSAHAAVIGAAMRRVDDLPEATVVAPAAERFLVEAARHEDPQALRRSAALLLDRLDPDGVEPREDVTYRRRGFTLGKPGDGSAVPSGRWTGEATAIWEAILDSLAAPVPAQDGAADDRTPAQRRHDAMLEAGKRLLRSGTLPATGGTPVTVLVRTTPADLTAAGGLVQTERGEFLSTASIVGCGDRCAAEADVLTIGLGPVGEILNHGRTRRLASTAQRRALAVRDGGCCFPGCTRPAAWTEVHHVKTWLDGGPTDIDNLCLLCAHHHREVNRTDWRLTMNHGIPQWIPPPWLDHDQRPVRNTAHHLPDIGFDLPEWSVRRDSG